MLGKEFNLSLLSAVHPRVNYLQAIQQHLRDLVKEGYISIVSRSSAAASMSDDSEPQSSAPDIPLDAVISFTSELFRDVAYGTLLQEQQIEIHAAAFKYMLKDRETNKHSQYQPGRPERFACTACIVDQVASSVARLPCVLRLHVAERARVPGGHHRGMPGEARMG